MVRRLQLDLDLTTRQVIERNYYDNFEQLRAVLVSFRMKRWTEGYQKSFSCILYSSRRDDAPKSKAAVDGRFTGSHTPIRRAMGSVTCLDLAVAVL